MSSHSSDAAPVAPATTERNNLAVASLIVGIVSLVLCVAFAPAVVGLVLGLIALKQIKSSGAGGRGMALAGVVTSAVSLVLGVVVIAAAASGGDKPTTEATGTPPSASAPSVSTAPPSRPSAPPPPTATAEPTPTPTASLADTVWNRIQEVFPDGQVPSDSPLFAVTKVEDGAPGTIWVYVQETLTTAGREQVARHVFNLGAR